MSGIQKGGARILARERISPPAHERINSQKNARFSFALAAGALKTIHSKLEGMFFRAPRERINSQKNARFSFALPRGDLKQNEQNPRADAFSFSGRGSPKQVSGFPSRKKKNAPRMGAFRSFCFVGVKGFEPSASTSRTWRANRTALHPAQIGCKYSHFFHAANDLMQKTLAEKISLRKINAPGGVRQAQNRVLFHPKHPSLTQKNRRHGTKTTALAEHTLYNKERYRGCSSKA